MNADYRIVIPARMASQRLPGKPLILINGLPLIQHVYSRAKESSANSIVVATDSTEILKACHAFGADAVMTSSEHQSGSDRIAECIDTLGWTDETLVVNLQGDEPLMPAACLDQAARILNSAPDAVAASLFWPIDTAEQAEDSNVVKVVTDQAGRALYFSRSVVPYPRGTDIATAMDAGAVWHRHIGLYAYRAGALRAFTTMPVSPLERLEKLEQLRFLEAGSVIRMERADCFIPAGVDSPEDLERVQNILSGVAD
jgi:3-deoxy-manno-octulosonate cytidylyltransferase (CMP-KDO synthetase)